MKATLLSAVLASTAAALPHLEPRAARYEGYKVLRMDTGDKLEEVKRLLADFDYEEWSHDVSEHIDFSLPADQAKKLEDLGARFEEMHSDLGRDIADEGRPCGYKGMDVGF
jgi:hypothetical protein